MTICCENELLVSSQNEEQLENFIRKMTGTVNNSTMSLNNFLPCPDELLELDRSNKELSHDECDKLVAKYGYSNRHDWEETNWGTSPDIECGELRGIDTFITIKFLSCWSPPLKWLSTTVMEYPDLHFRLKYDDPLRGIMGIFIAHGKNIFDKCIEYEDR